MSGRNAAVRSVLIALVLVAVLYPIRLAYNSVTNGATNVPICWEDQVLTHDGICVNPGDPYVKYVPAVGWMID